MNEMLLAAAEAGLDSREILAYGLFILGLTMIVVEIFVPGVVIGFFGLIGVVTGIVLGFGVSTTLGSVLAVIGVVTLPVFLVIWIKVVGPALAHKGKVKDDEKALESLHSLLNQEGVALTMLRPAGMARFGDRRVDVVTDGEIIDKDTRVKAVEVRGNQVMVRAIRM